MKIKSIEKKGENLFLVIYRGFFGGLKKRFVIQTCPVESNVLPFYFRSNDGIMSHVHDDMGAKQLKWMVENKVDKFDNDEEL